MGYETYPFPSYRELMNLSHTIKFKLQFTPVYSSLPPMSLFHHLISQIYPAYVSSQCTTHRLDSRPLLPRWWPSVSEFITWFGQIPTATSSLGTGVYYHSLSSLFQAVIPAIWRAARWWKPSNTFSIAPVATQLLLSYSSTICATAV